MKSPIIVCGFHHSGTRLLSLILKREGVFQVMNTPTNEWSLIQQINNRIGNWKNIDKIRETKKITVLEKARILYGLAKNKYNFVGHWGFKDPRNCVTIGSWIRSFQKAQVIHIVRHPVDTIGTLPSTYKKSNKNKRRGVFWTELWDYYNHNVESMKNKYDNYILVRFEDICYKPYDSIKKIKEACSIGGEKICFDVSKIKEKKAHIHRRKKIERGDIIRSKCEMMDKYGYE